MAFAKPVIFVFLERPAREATIADLIFAKGLTEEGMRAIHANLE